MCLKHTLRTYNSRHYVISFIRITTVYWPHTHDTYTLSCIRSSHVDFYLHACICPLESDIACNVSWYLAPRLSSQVTICENATCLFTVSRPRSISTLIYSLSISQEYARTNAFNLFHTLSESQNSFWFNTASYARTHCISVRCVCCIFSKCHTDRRITYVFRSHARFTTARELMCSFHISRFYTQAFFARTLLAIDSKDTHNWSILPAVHTLLELKD
jgi:hypothetical protein